METIRDFRNNLLKRKEVKVVFEAGSNPGFEESMKKVAQHFKADESKIALKNVKSKFGRNTFLIDAFIYDSAEDRERIEPKIKVKKEGAAASAAPTK